MYSWKKYVSLFYILTLCLSFVVITPADACACGMLVAESSKDIAMKGERGAVVYEAGLQKEQMAIDFQLTGTSNQSALVVPTPVKADISQVKKEVIDDIEYLIKPHYKSIDSVSIGAVPNAKQSVQVLERKTVGSFEIAALKADTYEDLFNWTKDNGFKLQPEAESPVRSYLESGFVLNVIKLKKNASDSDINPLEFTFRTNKLFYPLMEVKDSRDSLKDKSLNLYLITDEKTNLSSYADVSNRSISRASLEDSISKTSDSKFSNLAFSSQNYYLTYINTSNYGEDGNLIGELGNPIMRSYPPLGLNYNSASISQIFLNIFLVFIMIVLLGFLFLLKIAQATVGTKEETPENISSNNYQ